MKMGTFLLVIGFIWHAFSLHHWNPMTKSADTARERAPACGRKQCIRNPLDVAQVAADTISSSAWNRCYNACCCLGRRPKADYVVRVRQTLTKPRQSSSLFHDSSEVAIRLLFSILRCYTTKAKDIQELWHPPSEQFHTFRTRFEGTKKVRTLPLSMPMELSSEDKQCH
jgi:hypothetical protein